jgi:phage terminase large subunit-like protein
LSRAARVIAFVESLTITSGAHAGRKFLLRPWQKTIVEKWYATDTSGHRQVRTGLLTLARKNGKTSLCAALALAHLVGPEVERRGQIIAAARDRDQSSLLFDEVSAFILDNQAFSARCNIQRHAKVIEDLTSGTKFRAMSSDAAKAHGLSPSVIIVDELAQWGTGAGRELYEALTTATGARDEPLTLIISTQTPNELSLMSELVDYGRDVNNGTVQDKAFAADIFEVPLEADPFDETLWPLANPALDDFRSLDEMRSYADRARIMPRLMASFRNFYLNQRVEAEMAWLPMDLWDACEEPRKLEELRGKRCFAGLDLSTSTDLSAFVLVFPDEHGGFDVVARAWCPADTIRERSQRDRAPYLHWRDQNYLTTTSGNTVDYDVIREDIKSLAADYAIAEIAYDRWNSHQIVTQLQHDGAKLVPFGQGFLSMSGPAKELEKLVLSGKLRHGGHPVLRWCISNTVVEQDAAGNIKPSKRKSTERIDLTVALVMALARAITDGGGPSVYETRGVLTL